MLARMQALFGSYSTAHDVVGAEYYAIVPEDAALEHKYAVQIHKIILPGCLKSQTK